MNQHSFEVQTVHGLKETFVVSPNGTVDTTKSHTNRAPANPSGAPAADRQDNSADAGYSARPR